MAGVSRSMCDCRSKSKQMAFRLTENIGQTMIRISCYEQWSVFKLSAMPEVARAILRIERDMKENGCGDKAATALGSVGKN